MPTRIIRAPEHVDALAAMLRGRKMPMTVQWTQGAPLSNAQRRLSFQWYMDAASQLGDQTAAEVRAECKVVFAAPILCQHSEAFRASWEKLRQRFTHEDVLEFVEQTELPMTSLMTVKQMTEYLDTVQRHYSQQGVRLTDPEMLKYQSEFA